MTKLPSPFAADTEVPIDRSQAQIKSLLIAYGAVETDGSDWSLAHWANAVTGELGEAANLIKKIERRDFTLDEARIELGKELADVQTYLDILAFRCGVDLGAATIEKFNEVSERIGCDVRLGRRLVERGGRDSHNDAIYTTLVTPSVLDAVHKALAALDKVREAGG